ncbi:MULTISPECIES: hypothetical protein [Aeromicrobium]|jgi:hypothetical protein|uniref:hypothetical protein n=1 Tax=Aeromicrobium TaxID=2040 RepID=UPI00082AB0C6|nr:MULTISPECIES: hypothetical protein [Aeromicrobium]
MTWDAYNRRKSALREVLQLADRRREDTADQLLDATPGAREAFGDELSLLFDVQMAWYQRLSGQLDRTVLEGDAPATVAVEAWVAAAAAMPGARALLDAHRDRPELAKAFAKEQALLAVSAGVSSWHPDLLGQGERIVAEARDRAVHAPVDTLPSRDGEGRASAFIARLRNALAA